MTAALAVTATCTAAAEGDYFIQASTDHINVVPYNSNVTIWVGCASTSKDCEVTWDFWNDPTWGSGSTKYTIKAGTWLHRVDMHYGQHYEIDVKNELPLYLGDDMSVMNKGLFSNGAPLTAVANGVKHMIYADNRVTLKLQIDANGKKVYESHGRLSYTLDGLDRWTVDPEQQGAGQFNVMGWVPTSARGTWRGHIALSGTDPIDLGVIRRPLASWRVPLRARISTVVRGDQIMKDVKTATKFTMHATPGYVVCTLDGTCENTLYSDSADGDMTVEVMNSQPLAPGQNSTVLHVTVEVL